MSEEIKHLRVLAKEYATKTMENEWTWHFDYDDCVTEKFAQLIVLQCIDLCLDRHHTWRWDDEPDSSSGPRDCAESIKTYFGVK